MVDPSLLIRNVWSDNLEWEMEAIRNTVGIYNYISMDTEFPGIVARPLYPTKCVADISYQTLKCNVDILNLIQLGLTFTDENGRYPTNGPCTWQFHFKFNLTEDMYSQESIELLTKSGIDFQKHEISGISIEDFGALLTSSGVIMSDNVRWISFHSGYDFGYLLKILICTPLPHTEAQFFTLLKTFFPIIYDVKHLMKSCKNLKGGLQDVADSLGVMRIGPQHQAGSDSLLTATTFFQMRRIFFDDKIDDAKYAGQLFGLTSYTIPATNPADSLLLLPHVSSSEQTFSSQSKREAVV